MRSAGCPPATALPVYTQDDVIVSGERYPNGKLATERDCPECGKPNRAGQTHCAICGTLLGTDDATCASAAPVPPVRPAASQLRIPAQPGQDPERGSESSAFVEVAMHPSPAGDRVRRSARRYDRPWLWPVAAATFLIVTVGLYWLGTVLVSRGGSGALLMAFPRAAATPRSDRPVVESPGRALPDPVRQAPPAASSHTFAPTRVSPSVPLPPPPPSPTPPIAAPQPVVPKVEPPPRAAARPREPAAAALPPELLVAPSVPEASAAPATDVLPPAPLDTYRAAVARHNARVDEYNLIVAEMHRRDAWNDSASFGELHAQLERARVAVERARGQVELMRGRLDAERAGRRGGA